MRIFFFDMEGTLLKKNSILDNGKVAPSAWTVLAKEIGEECYLDEEKTKDLWIQKKYISYTQWMKDTLKIHIKHGMEKRHLEKIISMAELQDGAQELISAIRAEGSITALISGGFKELADVVQLSLKIDHAYSACEYFFDDDGRVVHFNLLPTDELGKFVFMEHLASEYNIKLNDCVFVGDGKNDVFLARRVGMSIAFNAQPELRSISTHAIDQEVPDLSAIIPIVFS